jgi:hypothetical protein
MRARRLEASSAPNTKRAPGSRRRAGNRKGVILRSRVFNIALEFFSKPLHFVADTHRLNLRSTHAATNAPLLRRNLRSEHPLAIERNAKKVSAQADSAVIARCNLHTRQRTNGRRGDRLLPVLVKSFVAVHYPGRGPCLYFAAEGNFHDGIFLREFVPSDDAAVFAAKAARLRDVNDRRATASVTTMDSCIGTRQAQLSTIAKN